MATTTERARFRADFADPNGTIPEWSNDEIDNLFTRAAEFYPNSSLCQFYKARLIGMDELLIDTARDTDYSAGGDSDAIGQVFGHLLQLRPLWEQELRDAENKSLTKVQWGQPLPKPTRVRPMPTNW